MAASSALVEIEVLIRGMLVEQLQDCCTLLRLVRGGRKAELIDRLMRQIRELDTTHPTYVSGQLLQKVREISSTRRRAGYSNTSSQPQQPQTVASHPSVPQLMPKPQVHPSFYSGSQMPAHTTNPGMGNAYGFQYPSGGGGTGSAVDPSQPCCPCGSKHPYVNPTTQDSCKDCGVIYNKACVPMGADRLCFLCFAKHAEPMFTHAQVLVYPRFVYNLKNFAMNFAAPEFAFDTTSKYGIFLMSVKCTMEKGEPGRFLLWPRQPQLNVNQNGYDIKVMLDRTGHIAPCRPLDITAACSKYRMNSVAFRTQEPKLHVAMIVVCKVQSEAECAANILATRGLSPSIAALSVLASFTTGTDDRLKTIAGLRELCRTMPASSVIALAKGVKGASADDDDDDIIEATSTVIALKDSVSWAPIQVPVRGDVCRHLQCFDLTGFLLLHSRPSLKRWECPVCHNVLTVAGLVVDTYFLRILDSLKAGVTHGPALPPLTTLSLDFEAVVVKPTSPSVDMPDKLRVEPDGSWEVLRETVKDEGKDTTLEPPMKKPATAPMMSVQPPVLTTITRPTPSPTPTTPSVTPTLPTVSTGTQNGVATTSSTPTSRSIAPVTPQTSMNGGNGRANGVRPAVNPTTPVVPYVPPPPPPVTEPHVIDLLSDSEDDDDDDDYGGASRGGRSTWTNANGVSYARRS